ncbi:relaxase/mobilization nuclease domain-containing protein [Dinghuibacter silviterrae]|uniref:Relaxase/mobilization nuclease-like protein n=1 Tax=Dinghuibacter silviterrae TaxID=1539049 RepID=A0A4R8DV73_9BACT|nr:relaxase/mobilization nuclease domain-containing protein [Dinghuibacter silviterrae]TDX01818.1 relaxase/mobilization nuclease-like protein [Dinghuibacter silviterrae]
MITQLRQALNIRKAIHYNEKKVSGGFARLLLEENAPIDVSLLKSGLHIVLAFDPGDQLGSDSLASLSRRYMFHMDLDHESFRVYQHLDTFHPHLHVVTSYDSFISERRLRMQSKRVTRELEHEFDLVRTQPLRDTDYVFMTKLDGHQHLLDGEPVYPARYGKEVMGRAIHRTVSKVLEDYQFTSLVAYNALLRMYNIKADRGRPGSRIYEHRGLVYRLLDERGKTLGMGIKASRIPGKPTLAFLEDRFARSRSNEENASRRIRTYIDWFMQGDTPPLPALQEDLLAVGVQLLWNGDQLAFLDNRSCWVISGESLGPEYTASTLIERCQAQQKDLVLCHSLSHTADWPSQSR